MVIHYPQHTEERVFELVDYRARQAILLVPQDAMVALLLRGGGANAQQACLHLGSLVISHLPCVSFSFSLSLSLSLSFSSFGSALRCHWRATMGHDATCKRQMTCPFAVSRPAALFYGLSVISLVCVSGK